MLSATLFLTPFFWILFQHGIPMYWSILPFTLIVAIGSVAIGALFFWAPAAAAHKSTLSLNRILENATGTIPAAVLRLCAISFLVFWMARAVRVIALFTPRILRRDSVSSVEVGLITAAILLLALATALQSAATAAKLANFSNKLGVVILIAALIRVRDGLPVAMLGSDAGFVTSRFSYVWYGLSDMLLYLIPLGLLTGVALGRRLQPGRNRQLTMTAGIGFVLPLFVATLLTAVILEATVRSPPFRPSLPPNVPMALWSGVAERGVQTSAMIVLVAMLGTFRLGMRLLTEAIDKPEPTWRTLTVLSLAIAGLSLHHYDFLDLALKASAASLICAAAIVTTERIVPSHRTSHPPRVDPTAVLALLTGLGVSASWNALTGEPSWPPTWPLPAYAATLAVCLLGRLFRTRNAW